MKKNNGVAVFMAALLMLSSVSVVSADTTDTHSSGKSQGTGSFEGNISTNVFNVEFPLLAETDEESLEFILDPNDLITKTNAVRYGSAEFTGDKGFYFKNEGGTYSNVSDEITATNKSSFDVNISVEASIIDCSSIVFAENESDFDDKASICVLLKDDNESSAIGDEAAVINGSVDKGDTSAFMLSYDEENGYVYSETGIVAADAFKSYAFHLEGAANKDGDWSEVPDDIAPKLDLVWNVDKKLGNIAPYIENMSGKKMPDGSALVLKTNEDVKIKVNLGSEDLAATSFTMGLYDTDNDAVNQIDVLANPNYCTYDNESGILTFKAAFANDISKMNAKSGGKVTGGAFDFCFSNNEGFVGDNVHLTFTIS